MPVISLEQQQQLRRQLNQLQQSAPEAATPDENTGQSGQMPALGVAGFIMLGGFAILKDIFDFVFVAMAFFKSKIGAGADVAGTAADVTSMVLALIPEPTGGTKVAAIVAKIISYGAMGVSWIAGIYEAKIQAEGVILPFVFTHMFMIIVVAVLLLSGLGLKSYKVFLSSRTIILSLIAIVVEIIPVLNIFPWLTIYVILLFIHVKSLLKEQAEEQKREQELEQAQAQPA